MELTPSQARVLGCLVEKEQATPQQYPMTLVALRAACNQRTNRDPVVDYAEGEVREALTELRRLDLVRPVGSPGSRTMRYVHLLDETYSLDEARLAVLALLLVRGPQTVGELRTRSERLHTFADLAEVHDALARLAVHPFGALVAEQPRRPGQKEVRFATTLAPVTDASPGDRSEDTGSADVDGPPIPPDVGPTTLYAEELTELTAEVAELRDEMAALRARVDRLGGIDPESTGRDEGYEG